MRSVDFDDVINDFAAEKSRFLNTTSTSGVRVEIGSTIICSFRNCGQSSHSLTQYSRSMPAVVPVPQAIEQLLTALRKVK